jgi:hypothetical protein
MVRNALFAGLIIDELERPVELSFVGNEPFYVVDDDGFRRHIETEYVDRQVLDSLGELMDGNEDLIAEGTMKMIGQDDLFTKAMIDSSLKNMEKQFDAMLDQGLPEEAKTWLGMLGFQVVIDYHGDVLRIDQPTVSGDDFD